SASLLRGLPLAVATAAGRFPHARSLASAAPRSRECLALVRVRAALAGLRVGAGRRGTGPGRGLPAHGPSRWSWAGAGPAGRGSPARRRPPRPHADQPPTGAARRVRHRGGRSRSDERGDTQGSAGGLSATQTRRGDASAAGPKGPGGAVAVSASAGSGALPARRAALLRPVCLEELRNSGLTKGLMMRLFIAYDVATATPEGERRVVRGGA